MNQAELVRVQPSVFLVGLPSLVRWAGMIRGDNISSLRVGSIRLSIVNPVAVTGYCSWFESCPYR